MRGLKKYSVYTAQAGNSNCDHYPLQI